MKAVRFVKPNRPSRIRPSSDQYWGARQSPQVRKQLRSNSSLLAVSANVGVPDECHILNLLDAHYGCQRPGLLVAPEHNTFVDLTPKFLDADGNIPKEIMPDGLHPNTKGYEIWAASMQPLLDEMMK